MRGTGFDSRSHPKWLIQKVVSIQDIAQCAKEGGSIYTIEVRVFYGSAASAGRLWCTNCV